jgi:predicted AAA+ superfamily ATPase
MEKDKLKQIILDNRTRLSRPFIRRDLEIDHGLLRRTGKIAAIVGPRRCGKSTYLIQVAQDLACSQRAIAFLDFSELPLSEFRSGDFELLYVAQKELCSDQDPVFLLDEIQEIASFESGLLYLAGHGSRVYLSGSSMRMVTGELASSLLGKILTYRLYPLSFPEYLRFRGAEDLDARKTDDAAIQYRHLDDYEWWGGFPEVVLADREDSRRNLIDSYVDVMLLRDVVEKLNVKNLVAARRILSRLLAAYTREFSISRWYNELRSMGMRISRDTVYEYVSHFEQSMFFLFAENEYAGATARRKVYLADNGLTQHTRPSQADSGKRFENHIFLWLTRLGRKVSFAKIDSGEVDLLFSETSAQVCLSINRSNASRELDPLCRARERGRRTILVVRDSRDLDAALIGDLKTVDIRDLVLDPLIMTRADR